MGRKRKPEKRHTTVGFEVTDLNKLHKSEEKALRIARDISAMAVKKVAESMDEIGLKTDIDTLKFCIEFSKK